MRFFTVFGCSLFLLFTGCSKLSDSVAKKVSSDVKEKKVSVIGDKGKYFYSNYEVLDEVPLTEKEKKGLRREKEAAMSLGMVVDIGIKKYEMNMMFSIPYDGLIQADGKFFKDRNTVEQYIDELALKDGSHQKCVRKVRGVWGASSCAEYKTIKNKDYDNVRTAIAERFKNLHEFKKSDEYKVKKLLAVMTMKKGDKSQTKVAITSLPKNN